MFLDILRNHLADLDASISQHEHLLQELKEQRATVQVQLDHFVYPILTLPPEITSEILLSCSEHNIGTMDPDMAPLLLLKICKAWREVALSIPALWDTICDTEFGDPQNMENAITTWFSRAGSRPLSLDVSYIGKRSTCMHSLIRRHASRLQFLTLGADADCFSDLAGIQSFPRLRHLTLSSFDGVLEANGTPIPVFSDTPLLCHLEVEHLPPSRLMMPLSQLIKFTATSVALQECLGGRGRVDHWAAAHVPLRPELSHRRRV
ncbi:hypothetical protein FB451DRAFT_276131 [Mycena latifolia]|nr:hypothetical protein FB451DRAFT_276131 [Mycena latifolia]